ncbi:hypothetical protein [Pseudomonas aeruginosa]|uniref:hypothetical protein n=1 Tax=Pseudomonas aeruginosa TaxID=287 RepID=UPI00273A0940|nr:hypothetical protein [Pseudomonas aeruginosa]
MSIDWDKAPEGTTHYHIGEDINPWRKIEGTVAYEHYRGKWLRVNSFNEGCMPGYYAPIPQETWDGQGLPPVGTVCEWHESDGWAYTESKVVAYTDDGLFVCMQKPGRRPEVLRIDNFEFRPVRTLEQIAAEEREKAIDAMLDLDPPHENGLGLTSRRQFCETLYDAGYRRQEEGK